MIMKAMDVVKLIAGVLALVFMYLALYEAWMHKHKDNSQ